MPNTNETKQNYRIKCIIMDSKEKCKLMHAIRNRLSD